MNCHLVVTTHFNFCVVSTLNLSSKVDSNLRGLTESAVAPVPSCDGYQTYICSFNHTLIFAVMEPKRNVENWFGSVAWYRTYGLLLTPFSCTTPAPVEMCVHLDCSFELLKFGTVEIWPSFYFLILWNMKYFTSK